jgi:plastocyanin
MRPTAVLVAIASCVLVAGCSGGEDSLKASDAVKTTTVTMPKSYKFAPAVISVKRGSTVTWKNRDNFTHDVSIQLTSGSDTKPHTVKPGKDLQLTFDEKGTFEYVCRFHSTDMRGKVIVT